MRLTAFLTLTLALCGCSGGMSRQVRDEAVELERFAQLSENPSDYKGNTVILGGEIIETRNQPEGTTILFLQRRLGWGRVPWKGSESEGRFMVRFGDFRDPALYTAGRLVTVAGRVVGAETELVDQAPYSYVLLEGREIRIWRDDELDDYRDYYDSYYPPFYLLGPYRPHRRHY
jgi:outer membrane lipoprotein